MHVHALFFVSNLGACLDIHSSFLDWLFIGINYYNKYLNCEKLRFTEFNGWISIHVLYSKYDNCFESLFFLISETKFMILEYLANNYNKSKSMSLGVYFVENFSYERCLLSNTPPPPKKKWLVRLKH